jgi:trans-aconitate methyltransferase
LPQYLITVIPEKQQHWETVYETKSPDQVSWTQDVPVHSLELIDNLKLDKSAPIIDIGGGDSTLVDHLLKRGFENVTVLDISAKALEKAKLRLGPKADQIHWIVGDVTEFQPKTQYHLWHDRAVFHFLTDQDQIHKYTDLTNNSVDAHLILATFSPQGLLKCSDLDVTQYNHHSLAETFQNRFQLDRHFYSDHLTPFGTTQNFLYGLFSKK